MSTLSNLLGATTPDSALLSFTATSSQAAGGVMVASINKYLLSVQNTCRQTCTQIQDGTTIIIGPGSTTGPIRVTQSCVVEDPVCALDSLIQASLLDTLNHLQSSSTLPAQPVYGLTPNSLNASASEIVETSLRQLISTTCNFETNQIMNDQFLYIGSNASTGSISFSQDSKTSQLACASNTLAASVGYLASTSAEAEQVSTSAFLRIILTGAVIVVVLMVALVVLFFVLSSQYDAVRVPAVPPEVLSKFWNQSIPAMGTYM